MNRAQITVIVLTKNEEENIDRCLGSLSFCHRVIVVDDYSTDKTISIAKRFKVDIFKHHMNSDFASQRNWALKKARTDWVFFVDADEEVSKKLAKEIISKTSMTDCVAFSVRRVDILWNKKLTHGEMGTSGYFGNATIVRLANKNAGTWVRKIHERWNIKGKVGCLNNELFHYPHQTMAEFIKDIGERSQIHAAELKREKKNANLLKIFLWPIGKFLYNVLFKFALLDGVQGFIVAITMSFHSFVSWTSLWLLKN